MPVKSAAQAHLDPSPDEIHRNCRVFHPRKIPSRSYVAKQGFWSQLPGTLFQSWCLGILCWDWLSSDLMSFAETRTVWSCISQEMPLFPSRSPFLKCISSQSVLLAPPRSLWTSATTPTAHRLPLQSLLLGNIAQAMESPCQPPCD